MLLDFYLLAAELFSGRLHPALTASWHSRSFSPCRALCREILEHLADTVATDSLLRLVVDGAPFRPRLWHGLAGELIILACEEMPLIQTAPETLRCLLAPDSGVPADSSRSGFAPIEQAHFGSGDLRFGGAFYRPDHAGFNDTADVRRLLAYLEAIDPTVWTEDMLTPMSEFATAAERAEELAFVRDWWPPLLEMYRDAARRDCVIVCERR
jgi:hypothetical protein